MLFTPTLFHHVVLVYDIYVIIVETGGLRGGGASLPEAPLLWTKLCHVIHWVATVAQTYHSVHWAALTCSSSLPKHDPISSAAFTHWTQSSYSLRIGLLFFFSLLHMLSFFSGCDGINLCPESLSEGKAADGWTEADFKTAQLIMTVGMESGRAVTKNLEN